MRYPITYSLPLVPRFLPHLSLLILLGLFTLPCSADVAVLTNRTDKPLRVSTLPRGSKMQPITIEPKDSRPIYFDVATKVRVRDSREVYDFKIEHGAAYYFARDQVTDALALQELGLGRHKVRRSADDDRLPALPNAGMIPVKLLVDDDERTHRSVWEPLLRARLASASDVLEAHCGVRFKVVAIETWNSSEEQKDFNRTLKEFEREVDPSPGRVAIGFTSQYRIEKGRYHLGGTRGPLYSHILLKERATNILEAERLELLVHELGHHLGAAHSPEQHSVMRPVLTGGLQRAVDATIKFDPVNTLLMSLMGEEIRRNRAKQVTDFSLESRRRLDTIYAALEPALPDDPAAGHYRKIVRSAGTTPIVKDVRRVLDHLVRVGELNQRLAREEANGELSGSRKPVHGDKLTELYVKQAALAAKRVRRESSTQAFLLALGIAMDDTDSLAILPVAGNLLSRVEDTVQRRQRLAAMGKPTMNDRADLTKHFFVSAHLATLVGSNAARSAGLAKEMLDSQGGTGFSFADMAANRAGIVFAGAVLNKRLSLDEIARSFTVKEFLPAIDDLAEGLDNQDFLENYGGVSDPRFKAELARIERRVTALVTKWPTKSKTTTESN
ncbi:hypothetical protein [Adhaeretor mobilis]|uniref:Peptidase M10 metallopeptidase domain-containing protein n=1 Tax=Adhaeretor mobilis TaxID=1930276 RepID=A0A517MYE9_9BACT|nr:hypothetical protein [Adhaeretor mobilis]QDS99889.1 hypothetical protein HG15A2_32200 [Adhaeretor mobilis]